MIPYRRVRGILKEYVKGEVPHDGVVCVKDFLDYCTTELFSERNPILHGRVTNFGNKLEANKKLLALEMVISTVHSNQVETAEIYVKQIFGTDFKKFQKTLQNQDKKNALKMLTDKLQSKQR